MFTPPNFPAGFGAVMYSIAVMLSRAAVDGRTLILDFQWNKGWFTHAIGPEGCPNRDAQAPWDCYFRPFSSCSLAQALVRPPRCRPAAAPRSSGGAEFVDG